MRLHRDRLWHNAIRGRRWRWRHLEAQPGVVVVEVPARQAERGAPVGDSGFTGCARRVDRRRGNNRGCHRCRGERGDHKPSHRLSLGDARLPIRNLGEVSIASDAAVVLDDRFSRELPEMAVRWQAEVPSDPRLLVLNERLAADLGLDAAWLGVPDGLRFLVGV